MTSMKKLDAMRAQIAGLAAERDEVEGASIPRDEAVGMIERVIAAPFSNTVIDPGGPNSRVDLDPAPTGLLNGSFGTSDLLETMKRPGVLRAIFPEQIATYLLKVYDEEIGNREPGLPMAERRARLAELDAQIYKLEVAEEELIEALEAEGHDITRRAAANPAAALGLAPHHEAA